MLQKFVPTKSKVNGKVKPNSAISVTQNSFYVHTDLQKVQDKREFPVKLVSYLPQSSKHTRQPEAAKRPIVFFPCNMSASAGYDLAHKAD